MTYTNYLYHHGIKGQKWGVRRFQNEDGSVTAAGAKRYNDGGPSNKKQATNNSKPNDISALLKEKRRLGDEAFNNKNTKEERDKYYKQYKKAESESMKQIYNTKTGHDVIENWKQYREELRSDPERLKKEGPTLISKRKKEVEKILNDPDIKDLDKESKAIIKSDVDYLLSTIK